MGCVLEIELNFITFGSMRSLNAYLVDGDGTGYVTCRSGRSDGLYHAMLIDGKYYLHNEKGPSVECVGDRYTSGYYLAGRECGIDDLPCDDEMKMILKLKYGERERSPWVSG